MKRIRFVVLVLLITLLSFLLLSCGGGVAVVLDLTTAKAQFLNWIDEQEDVPDFAVGNFVCALTVGDDVSSEDPSEETASARQPVKMNEDGWLFYLDEQPGGFYPHPGRMLAISKTGKIMLQEETQGWPKVNDSIPEIMTQPISSRITKKPSEHTVYNPGEIYIPVVDIHYNIDIIRRFFRVYGAVVTNGLTPSQNLYYEASQVHDQVVDAMEGFFGADYVRAVDFSNNKPADIAAAVSDLVDNENVGNITMYFIAHGNIEYMNMGGTGYYASTLKDLIESYPNVRFNLIIETCHGGSWTDYFAALGATGIANLDMCISSTTRDKGAYPDWDSSSGITDYNAADDQYVEFTSDFLLQMEFYTAESNWPTVLALTDPAFPNNNTLKLYWICYQNARNQMYPVDALPSVHSYVLTERAAISIQEPQIYHPY